MYFAAKVIPAILAKYTVSPTAKAIIAAYNHFRHAWNVMNHYSDNTDDLGNVDERRKLQKAFQGYLIGLKDAEVMVQQFPVRESRTLLSAYLNIYKDDLVAEYLNFYLHYSTADRSNYLSECFKLQWLQDFANKLLNEPTSEHSRSLLWTVYFRLGTLYTNSHQEQTAVDYLKRCLDLDKKSLPAMYALGYALRNIDPERSVKHLETFLEIAPICDKNYTKAMYTLGLIHFNGYQDNDKAKHYYLKGLDAERYMLPFHCTEKFDPKAILELFMMSETEVNWKVLASLTLFACASICAILIL